MRVLLRDLAPGQDYAIQFRSNDGRGGVSDWSQVQRFTTTNDTMPPANVLNLTWFDSGTSFIGQWDRVSTNHDGSPLKDFRYYHCQVTNGQVTEDIYVVNERVEFTQAQNIAVFGTLQTALTLKVTAVDLTYNESLVPAILAVNPLAPPVPSTPVISNYLGLLLVSWDGRSSANSTMPTNFNYCEVHVSTEDGFTPTGSTFVGRVFADGSASRFTVPGLTYGTTYYVRLIGVNLLGKRSGASAQASGAPGRISGLDISNGQISADQINFTARDIGGSNAYYSTSQPVDGVGGIKLRSGDIWYDTDDHYTTYRYNGTTWVAAPEIGVITGTKILAGTLTADAVGTNLLIASSANIADAIIDDAKISTLSASKIITGSIQANQRIIAGPETENHAEMTSTGFYVKGPQPGGAVGATPVIIDRIRMGTGVSDFFAIPDPLDPDSTLAQIDENGIASFQGIYSETDPTFQGQKLSRLLGAKSQSVGEAFMTVSGLEPGGSAGLRGEYGIGQMSFDAEAGKLYKITARLAFWYVTNGGEVFVKMRGQWDNRTPAQVAANVAPTPVTNASPELYANLHNGMVNGWWQGPVEEFYWLADQTRTVSIGFSMGLNNPIDASSVLKVAEGAGLYYQIQDMGYSKARAGRLHNQGGSLYAYTTPPPPVTQPQNFYWESRPNWVHSYKGNGQWMSNDGGRAYQGTDPSGYNGNQWSLLGWNGDIANMLSGAYNIGVHVYLYFAHWYYNAGGTARIGYSSTWGDPGGNPAPFGIAGTFDYGGWPKPGGIEVDISGWAGLFQGGQARSIGLGPGNNGLQNYGYATDCILKIWYTKNV